MRAHASRQDMHALLRCCFAEHATGLGAAWPASGAHHGYAACPSHQQTLTPPPEAGADTHPAVQAVADKPAVVVLDLRTIASMMSVSTFGASPAMQARRGALDAALVPYCEVRVGADACKGIFKERPEVRGAVYEVRGSPPPAHIAMSRQAAEPGARPCAPPPGLCRWETVLGDFSATSEY